MIPIYLPAYAWKPKKNQGKNKKKKQEKKREEKRRKA